MLTDFGKKVKIELIKRDMTMAELCKSITKYGEVYCDVPKLSNLLSGRISNKQMEKRIKNILNLED